MRNIKNNKKKGFFKKTFVKICRLFGYEIIDQSDFIFPVSNKNSDDNLSTLGKNSITIPLGKTTITRPVKSLVIIIKTCTSVNLVTQSKKRIFEKDKSEYTFRTLNSLIKSLDYNRMEGICTRQEVPERCSSWNKAVGMALFSTSHSSKSVLVVILALCFYLQ